MVEKEHTNMEVEAVQKLYDQGKIAEAMEAVWGEVMEVRKADNPDIGKLKVIRAWCHWRRQEWEDARQWLREAEEAGGAELQTKRLRAYFAAYRDKDDARLRDIAQGLGDDVGVQNALVIRARDPGSDIVVLDELEVILAPFARSREVDAANLFHNAARLMLAKGSTETHFAAALSLIDDALERYGSVMHWHHRAAATFWRSHILERLGRLELAQKAIAASVQLWEKAAELDPSNQGFTANLENARRRAAEL